MIDWILVFNVFITMLVCWNAFDIWVMKKKQRVIEKIQNGDFSSEGEPTF